jgi:hypothetical protein
MFQRWPGCQCDKWKKKNEEKKRKKEKKKEEKKKKKNRDTCSFHTAETLGDSPLLRPSTAVVVVVGDFASPPPCIHIVTRIIQIYINYYNMMIYINDI